jgi:uncharacterized protein YdaU (DUF1376 family)
MRYYKHNIGDFFADTYYLSNERLAVYTKLVWEYYLQEKPITVDDYEEKAYELKTDEPTLTYVLNKYFYLDEDIDNEIWRHKRIDTELMKMNSANQQRSDSMKNHHQSNGNKDTKINGFDKFWEAYPNKKDKQKAIKAWVKHQPNIVDVLKAIVTQKNSEQWKKDNGQYIPLPTTWLNGARWEDEINTTKSTNSTYAQYIK